MNKNPETADLVVDYNGERKKAVDYVFNKSTDIVSVLIVNGLVSFFFRRRNANQVKSLQNYMKISLLARRADESLHQLRGGRLQSYRSCFSQSRCDSELHAKRARKN